MSGDRRDDIPAREGPLGQERDAGGFPKGIEGQRGDKDSAEQARRAFLEPRAYPGGVDAEAAGPAGDSDADATGAGVDRPAEEQPAEEPAPDFRAGATGSQLDEVERLLATPAAALQAAVGSDMASLDIDSLDAAVGGISIAAVRTNSQAGGQTAFLRSSDALALVIDLAASQALVDSGARFDANFLVVEYATNTVKINQWTRNAGFAWGRWFWISRGNNWGPASSDYTTPERWGLAPGLHIFRATVEIQGQGAFAASKDHVFRVR